ncbi:MAG: hypothetical protein M3457_03455 [Chloroflexota bacterium]|nr:hypothetical protein [Chloroflexota bacterium]
MLTPNPARDPDGFIQVGEARRPDTVTVFTRSMLGSGLLGSLLDRIDRILDDFEKRNLPVARPAESTGDASAGRVDIPLAPAMDPDLGR